jgi:hypothetical protein
MTRLEENLAAVAVELTADDLRVSEVTASSVTIQGARPPQAVLTLTDR